MVTRQGSGAGIPAVGFSGRVSPPGPQEKGPVSAGLEGRCAGGSSHRRHSWSAPALRSTAVCRRAQGPGAEQFMKRPPPQEDHSRTRGHSVQPPGTSLSRVDYCIQAHSPLPQARPPCITVCKSFTALSPRRHSTELSSSSRAVWGLNLLWVTAHTRASPGDAAG